VNKDGSWVLLTWPSSLKFNDSVFLYAESFLLFNSQTLWHFCTRHNVTTQRSGDFNNAVAVGAHPY
jgi:hypothetical protein